MLLIATAVLPVIDGVYLIPSSNTAYGIFENEKNEYNNNHNNFNECFHFDDLKPRVNYNNLKNVFLGNIRWYSLNSEQPNPYEDYIENHHYYDACFTTVYENQQSELSSDYILILVDEDLFPQIVSNLDIFRDDLEGEGYSVIVETLSGGSPEDVKVRIQDHNMHKHCDVIMIGDIPIAWVGLPTGEIFSCDLFYMDLDGNWGVPSSGVYMADQHSGDMGPEIFVGRIYASTLTCDTESNIVNKYLEKTSNYRKGLLNQPFRGIEYIEHEFVTDPMALDKIYGSNVDRFDIGQETTADHFLNKLDTGYHFLILSSHGNPWATYFGTVPTMSSSYAHAYVYSPTDRDAILVLGCDDGIKVWLNGDNVFTDDRLGGWTKDEFSAYVHLNAGWNRLLCKVSQYWRDHSLSAVFSSLYGPTIIPDLKYSVSNPEIHGVDASYINTWLINGFHEDVESNFEYYLSTNYLGVDESSIDPVSGEIMGGKTWTVYDSSGCYLNLDDYSGNLDFGVSYAYVNINSDTEKNCQLWMGYDDGARIWLNGDEILNHYRMAPFELDMTKIDVTLKTGENRLLLKISEHVWDHGFSARLCYADGTEVPGLTFYPAQQSGYIYQWLINGPYLNLDDSTRLSQDYLVDEANVAPNEGDISSSGIIWERSVGKKGCPFSLATFFDHGRGVSSWEIQSRDPRLLFSFLYACSIGSLTELDYLAGSYVFPTTNGLISITSTQSMYSGMEYVSLFDYMGHGNNFGKAFMKWLDDKAPYDPWEQYLYYGSVLFGDPTLWVYKTNPPNKPSKPSGPTSGKVGVEYDYKSITTDPDGDQIFYLFDWDDGTDSGWLGPYNTGDEVSAKHKWISQGNYQIMVKAKDTTDLESEWSDPLSVSIPKTKPNIINTLFQWFPEKSLKQHPLIHQLLQRLLDI